MPIHGVDRPPRQVPTVEPHIPWSTGRPRRWRPRRCSRREAALPLGCYDPQRMATAPKVALTVEFPLRVVLYPAPDLPGQWIAHGLETDIVTQGDSAEHALAMMGDALSSLATHQGVRRRRPLRLRPAPKEVWDLTAEAIPLDLTARIARRRKRSAPSPDTGPWSLYGLLSKTPPATLAA